MTATQCCEPFCLLDREWDCDVGLQRTSKLKTRAQMLKCKLMAIFGGL